MIKNHAGGTVIRVTPTLSTDAYGDSEVLFNPTEIPMALATRGGVSELHTMFVLDASDQQNTDIRFIFTEKNTTDLGTINATGDFTLDSADGIILDADGGSISLKDGGTRFGILTNSSSDFVLENPISDKDILFKVKDDDTTITALTLDGSNNGAATFSSYLNTGGMVYVTQAADNDGIRFRGYSGANGYYGRI